MRRALGLLALGALGLTACNDGTDVTMARDACHAAATREGVELRPEPSGAQVGGDQSDLEFFANHAVGHERWAFFWEVERGHSDREVRCLTSGERIVRLTIDGAPVSVRQDG